MTGPLAGVRVLELAGLGPTPWAGTMLADLGAEVVRVDRPVPSVLELVPSDRDLMNRGRRPIAVDIRTDAGRDIVLALIERSDVLLEGFRPGVAERLGVGPDVSLERNPRLVYARVTGWGQDGPMAAAAGHDIDYIALTGALHTIGRAGEPPVPPLNLIADFGGGGMLAVAGVLAALVERATSGKGQVVDVAMVDGVALLQLLTYTLVNAGLWTDARGANLLDGGAPFYDTYVCADGLSMAVGALEPQFFAELVSVLGIDVDPASQYDRAAWPAIRRELTVAFLEKTRDEWAEIFAGRDACVAPVLSLDEAPQHPHLQERGTFVEVDGMVQPAPAPRFSRTPAADVAPPPERGAHTDAVLAELGLDTEEIAALRAAGTIS